MSARVAVAMMLTGALVALIGFGWLAAAADLRLELGVGVALLGAILLLLGVHRRDDG
jgi:hypothetical protein